MTHLKLLTFLAASLMFGLVASIPTSFNPASANNFAEKPQPVAQREPIVFNAETNYPEEPPIKDSKVIIRPVGSLPTLATSAKASKPANNNENTDGCKCEPLDSCPIEMMDFRFAVSCEYGTVRCCRPLEPVLTKQPPVNKPAIVTPAATVKWPKKSAMCKCKPRKECDRLFQQEAEEVDRKDEMTCPAGSVRCCETGNMGNIKEGIPPSGTHNLGATEFRPVQLPFLKMPQSTNQRISEQEPLPPTQELQSLESIVQPEVHQLPAQIISATIELSEQTKQPAESTTQPIPTHQRPAVSLQQVFRPSPQIQPHNGPMNQPMGVIRQPNNPNFPIRQNPSQPGGFHFMQPQPIGSPFLSQPPIHPPFRQQNPAAMPPQFGHQPPFQASVPGAQSSLTQQAFVEQAFGFGSPLGSFNPQQTAFGQPPQQQNAFGPPPQQQPALVPPPQRRPPSANLATHFQPPQRPAPQQNGGFFSSLMNMFGGGN